MPRITREELEENRGPLPIEPLDRGFGYTFGNSLRRVLLSSLEGAAVTSVKIEGVAHEFTTLQGVREDVIDIILNLKNLTSSVHGSRRRSRCGSRRRAAGPVTAADLEAPADPRDPQTRSSRSRTSPTKGRVEMTLTIGRGQRLCPRRTESAARSTRSA